MMGLPTVILFVAIFAQDVFGSGGGQPAWTYVGNSGPVNWSSMFRTCAGRKQSPINIETGNVKTEFWRPFTLKNYDQPPTRMRIKNNGHSAVVEMDGPAAPRVAQGGLKGEYIFAQFHFHWGVHSGLGSEHTIDGVRYPMELHMVHYKASYGSLGAAVQKGDGLAVLGVMLEVSETDNPALTPLATALMNVTNASMVADVSANYPLRAFLPGNLEKFYRYEGSLTTPSCNEVVTWTVFANAISVSEKQLRSFRNLMTTDGSKMVNNFRPPQALNSRKVSVSAESGADSAGMKKVGLTLYFMTSMAVLMMNM